MRPALLLWLVLAALGALAGLSAQKVRGKYGRLCNKDCPPHKPGSPWWCATDGIHRYHFDNQCAMNLHNCLYGLKVRFVRVGNCYPQ